MIARFLRIFRSSEFIAGIRTFFSWPLSDPMDKIHVLSKWNRLLDLSPNYHIYDTHTKVVSITKSRPMHLVITIFYRYQTRNRVMQRYSRLIFAFVSFILIVCVCNVGMRTKFTTVISRFATRRFPCTNWTGKRKIVYRKKNLFQRDLCKVYT